MDYSPPRAWAEIDLTALLHNYRYAKQCSGQEVMAVVKANAYGHGVVSVIKALESEQPAFYGVANVYEARELRAVLPDTRIYLLGAANATEYDEIVKSNFTPCASSMRELAIFGELARLNQTVLKVHLALDTGMGRGGFLVGSTEFKDALAYSHSNIEIEGIGSHLPVADEDADFTREQLSLFQKEAPMNFKDRHIAHSAGLMDYESYSMNLVRPGLMLYGSSPIPKYQQFLKPVMHLYSRISLIRDIPRGQGISYGRTYITQRDSKIATVGIGYADGLRRSLSGKELSVSINGQKAPIVGRITMDQIMIDVTNLQNCSTGDQVEIFGKNISVKEVAERADTIPWEIFTGIAPRVKRVVIEP